MICFGTINWRHPIGDRSEAVPIGGCPRPDKEYPIETQLELKMPLLPYRLENFAQYNNNTCIICTEFQNKGRRKHVRMNEI